MKKFKKAFKILGIIAVVLAVVFISSSLTYILLFEHATVQYANYEIIDRNLTWKKSGGVYWGSYKIGYGIEEGRASYVHRYLYKKIRGESTDEFIGAWAYCSSTGIFPSRYEFPIVLVNPNCEIDVWSDWNVDKIEIYKPVKYFYLAKSRVGSNGVRYDPEDTVVEIIESTDDKAIISELVDMRINNKSESLKITQSPHKKYEYYIRLNFEESESIVWEAQIGTYLDKIILYCNSGNEYYHSPDKDIGKDIVILPGTPLYDFIMDAIS